MKDFVADYWFAVAFVYIVTGLLLLLSLTGIVGISPLVWAALLALETLGLCCVEAKR